MRTNQRSPQSANIFKKVCLNYQSLNTCTQIRLATEQQSKMLSNIIDLIITSNIRLAPSNSLAVTASNIYIYTHKPIQLLKIIYFFLYFHCFLCESQRCLTDFVWDQDKLPNFGIIQCMNQFNLVLNIKIHKTIFCTFLHILLDHIMLYLYFWIKLRSKFFN